MKAKKRKVWQWATLLLLLLGLLMPVRAEAAQNSCTVTIPVQIEVERRAYSGWQDVYGDIERCDKGRSRFRPRRSGSGKEPVN